MPENPEYHDVGEQASFWRGLILGLAVSVPVVAWLSPRSGHETRDSIRQRGVGVGRRAGQTVRKPFDQVQDGVEQLQTRVDRLKGDSIEDALAEGKAIAAQKRAALPPPDE